MKIDLKSLGGKLSGATKKIKLLDKRSAGKGAARKYDSNRILSVAIVSLVVFIFTIEFIFAISIYAFKSDDVVTRKAAQIIPYPAAFTTSGIVTVAKYWKEKEYIEHFYASTKQETVSSNDLSGQILRQEAENEILNKEAIQFKISVSSKEVNAAMDQIFEGNGGQAEVEKALQDLYGLNVSEFKELVHTQLLRDAINKEVIKHVSVRHILIRLEEGETQEKVDEAKARIDGYLAEIKSGAISFEEAAKKYSEDVGSNADGGMLESFAREDMVKEFEDVAFSTKVGELSEPFQTSFGWHILKVENASGYIDQSFDGWLASLLKSNLVIYLYQDRG